MNTKQLWVGFTGSRSLLSAWQSRVTTIVDSLPGDAKIVVGDARGADGLVRYAAPQAQVFCAEDRTPRSLVKRSVSMVEHLAVHYDSWLVALPDAPCPAEIVPARSWRSGVTPSGTWSTTAMASGCGVGILVAWCSTEEPNLPAWPSGVWSRTDSPPWNRKAVVPLFVWMRTYPKGGK